MKIQKFTQINEKKSYGGPKCIKSCKDTIQVNKKG